MKKIDNKKVFGTLADIRPKCPPYRQGALDSLCSIYSALNAIRYLSADFGYKKAHALFSDMVAKIYEGKSAMPEIQEILCEGSDRIPFCCLEGTPYELNHKRPYHLKKNRPKTVNKFMVSLGALVNRPDRCSIIVVEDTLENWCHYTVVWGVDAQGLHLYDSSPRWNIIKPHQLLIDGGLEDEGNRFKLLPSWTEVVEAKR